MFKKHLLKPNIDGRRSLVALELKDYLDFEVKRIYYFYDIKRAGGHCHKVEKEFFICLAGQVIFEIDEGQGIEEVELQAKEAIYVKNYVWHRVVRASAEAMILALTSTNYDNKREDYIEDYHEFKKMSPLSLV